MISGAGDPQRSRQAMNAVDQRLVRRDAKLIQLFDPPFDKSPLNPGYIKGYIPGVRENGGQYTHGAIWTAMAFALMGENERAWELFALLNPMHHGATAEQIATYKVEPYVVAADVYAVRSAHRPRRLDLVHRISRLDVPIPHRNTARRFISRAIACESLLVFRRAGTATRFIIATDRPFITSQSTVCPPTALVNSSSTVKPWPTKRSP